MRRGVVILMLAITACGPMPGIQNIKMADVPTDEAQRALSIRVYDQTLPPPAIKQAIGEVSATSCKNKLWDKPSTKGDALAQLRLKALRMGANAVISVTYDEHGQDALGTNCWNSVTASGVAAIIEP
jgi:uncharacterized protein YbjQ (UPF0145 family)